MNREFKFRLHDKDGKVIGYEVHRKNEHNCFQIYQTSLRNGDPTDEMDVKKGYFIAAFYKCEFTGLKDKNGVDIYEGDFVNILSRSHKNNPNMFFYSNKGILKIKTNFGEFQISELELNPNNLEVVGNIHENPELLNY